jgi:hypothetical protein
MNTKYQILLEDFRTATSKVFTGRDRGLSVRIDSKINELETNFEFIEILIPPDVRSINPSFLEEFLDNVVIKLKPREFNRRFKFINTGRYDVQPDLEEAIESILREETALA